MAGYWDRVFQIKFTHFSSHFANVYNGTSHPVDVTRITQEGPDPFEAYAYSAHLNEDNDGARRLRLGQPEEPLPRKTQPTAGPSSLRTASRRCHQQPQACRGRL